MQSAEKPASPPKNKNPWKTAAFASNSQSNTEGGVPKTLFDVIQQAKSQSMENSSAPKTIFDVIQQAKAAKTNSIGDKTSLKTSAIIEHNKIRAYQCALEGNIIMCKGRLIYISIQ